MRSLRWPLAGVFGSLAMVIWSFEMPPPLAQILSDRMLSITPGALFGFLIDKLQLVGKPLFFLGTVGLEVVAGVVAALLLVPLARLRPPALLAAGAALGAVLAALARALLGGEAGAPSVVAGFLIYGVVTAAAGLLLGAALGEEASGRYGQPAQGRRRFLGMAAAAIGGVLAAGAALEIGRTLRGLGEHGSAAPAGPLEISDLVDLGEVADTHPGVVRGLPPASLTPALTPNRDFYVISKNFLDPVVDARSWSLRIQGPLVADPVTLSYEQLRALPSRSEYVTLECISNDVGGHLMSTARWTGVPLRDLLRHAGMRDAARWVAFTCADGYVESLPLEQALEPTTLVVYLMNGEPLPSKHGFPARIITTGRYGMKNPKWLRTIEPVQAPVEGFWEKQGWSTEALVKTTSRIDLPTEHQRVTPDLTFGGVAFAGTRGIKRVELSTDGGATWLPAELERPLSPYTWTLWYLTRQARRGSQVSALVRATDGTGAVQTAASTASYPAGSTGYDARRFSVD
ncbi:molybdopterin-binding oxidoreductase [bacterium]|nr:MAG: molybdopterin-binding oxidoreductase [bacterium]